MKQKNKNQRNFSVYISVNSADNGFSLIEILVAIGIVSVGIIAIVSLFNTNLKDEIRSKNKLTAIYLAQEAIEVVRQQRDNNWKSGVAWDTGFVIGGDSIVGLNDTGDVTDGWEIKEASGGNQWRKKVYYDTANSYYVQSKAAITGLRETNFERWITVTNNAACPAPHCLEITANVSHPSFSSNIQVSTRIYDWMP